MPSETPNATGAGAANPGAAATPAAGSVPSSYAGRYSDGRTAATHTATIAFGDDGIEIVHADTAETRRWPYASLSTAQPLRRDHTDALLRSATEPGATVFVATPGFVTKLARRAPHLTTGAERWRYLKPALAVVAGVAAIAGVTWALDWSPSRAVAGLIPERTWAAAGGQLASTFERDYPGCAADGAGRAALDKLIARLVAATPDKRPINLHVANWGLVNAFAMPGRHLLLTRGLIREAASPEEVAGVMGHEIGHAIEMHPETGIVRQLGLSVALKLVFAGSSSPLENIGGLLLLLRYTREGERQADAQAFELLERAKISAKPLGTFFQRLADKEGGSEIAKAAGKYELLSSHPALDERAKNARNRPDYPTEPIMTAAEWQAMRSLCKVDAKSRKGGDDDDDGPADKKPGDKGGGKKAPSENAPGDKGGAGKSGTGKGGTSL